MSQSTKAAVIYVRVSTDRQAKKGTSLDTQEEKCRAYAEKEGYQVIRIFREEGESAKAWRRPELLEMLEYLQKNKGKIEGLIIYKLDRLSRNSNDQHIIMYKLSQASVTLKSATENLEDDAVGRFMRTVLWGVAQFDNEIRGERTRSGQYKRFMDGYLPFPAPTGYISGKEEGTDRLLPVSHPEYGSLITWAAERRGAGVNYKAIAQGLKKRGFRTRQGNAASEQTVYKILHNSFYYGIMRSSKFGENVKGKHKPLISYDLWLQMRIVDGEVANPTPQRQRFNKNFPLVLRCPECEMRLSGRFPRGKMGVRYPYYHHYNKGCKFARSFNREVTHHNFLSFLNDLKPAQEHLNLFRKIVLEVAKQKSKTRQEEIQRFASKEKDLEKGKQQ